MKILLLDSAFSASPIHKYLEQCGHEVWTVGNRSDDHLAIAYPDRWINGNYSNVSFVKDIINLFSIDAVVPGCTDISMKTYAMLDINKYYSYSQETDLLINNKKAFRKLCDEIGLPSPKLLEKNSVTRYKEYICKPADSFSGNGASVFHGADTSAMEKAINTAKDYSLTGEVVCEEFVAGQLYSYSAFIKDKKIDSAYVVKEGSRYNRFSVDTSYLVSNYNKSRICELNQALEVLSDRLNLCNGLLHVQFIDSGTSLVLIEVTRRCPGDLYSLLIEDSTGHNYAAKYASYFIGEDERFDKLEQRFVIRHTIKHNMRYPFSEYDTKIYDDMYRLVPTARLGESANKEELRRVGIAFLEKNCLSEMEDKYNELIQHDYPKD